jgi:hypothetical protein
MIILRAPHVILSGAKDLARSIRNLFGITSRRAKWR